MTAAGDAEIDRHVTGGLPIDAVTIPWGGTDAALLRVIADRLDDHPELSLVSLLNHDFGHDRSPAEWEVLLHDSSPGGEACFDSDPSWPDAADSEVSGS